MGKSALETRNKRNTKKPEFQRQDVNIFKQFRGEWRSPKGIHSKLRKGYRGHSAVPSIGYSAPSEAKGLTKKGLIPFVIYNTKDLDSATNKNAVIIAHSVGMKNRIKILNKAKEKKIDILGFKDVDGFLAKINEKLILKKKKSSIKIEEKKKKIQESAKENKKPEETKTDEDKKDESKK